MESFLSFGLINLLTNLISIKVITSSLTSSPHIYPFMPNIGIKKKTKASRMRSPITLQKKVVPAFPRPCRMLDIVEEMYKKGHIKLSVKIKEPADGLSKSRFPKGFPKSRKKTVQKIPNREQ